MADCMMFPNDWHDFIKDYSFIDSERVYTNGSELIQVFRVTQLIEHLLKEQEAVKPVLDEQTGRIWLCGKCGSYVGFEDNDPHDPNEFNKYCHECGRPVLWEGQCFEKHLHGNTEDGVLYHHYCIKCGWDWWSKKAFPNRCSKCGRELTWN